MDGNFRVAPDELTQLYDFEAAVHQAVRVVFPGATINGCFYHLTQVNNDAHYSKRNLLSTP